MVEHGGRHLVGGPFGRPRANTWVDVHVRVVDLLIAFFTAAAIFAFIPGPGILYGAAQTSAGGRTVGLLGTLGLALGG